MTSGAQPRPRIGFLGTGWIGRHRMERILETGAVEAAAVCDPSETCRKEALALAPGAIVAREIGEMLDLGLEGMVIATPSALHASQSIAALERGAAVFCQKPLGRTAAEAAAVVAAARQADRLLAVDLSYRFTEGMRRIADIVRSGGIGHVHAVDLTFHNAYGPDKDWFYDPALSGGGCVMDLGVHLVDLALWTLDFPEVADVSSHLFANGTPLGNDPQVCEDHAVATLTLASGTVVRLACSWRLNAGRDAIIEAAFYGTNGGAALRNVNGGFYDFTAELYRDTATERLAAPPDEWGGRAGADWARRLAAGEGFDPEAERLIDVARILDRIYGRQDASAISAAFPSEASAR